MAEIVGGLQGTLTGTVNGLVNQGQSLLDRFLPPERREELQAKIAKFATEKPKFAAFLLSNLALSAPALFLFFLVTLTVLVFSLLAAILVGVLGALLFSAAAVGFALLILLPTLFVTTGAASFIWLWGLAAYYIVKWFNQTPVPGVHKGVGEGAMESDGPLEALGALGGAGRDAGAKARAAAERGEFVGGGGGDGGEEKGNGHAQNGSAEKKEGGKGQMGAALAQEKLRDVAKASGLDVEEVKKKMDGGFSVDKLGEVAKASGVDVGELKKKANLGGLQGKLPGGLL